MHVIEIARIGGPDVLDYVERPQPSPGPGEVLIKAEAIGVNFIDTYFRAGMYPHELPFVLGSEVSGTVAAIGADVTTLQVGQRVATADAVGAYAEYCLAPVDLAARVPDAVSSEVAAAVLLKGLTAHFLIKSVYPVQRGDTVLLHAGACGVGLILTQWATSMGVHVITTVSSPQKAELSRRAGAVEVLDYPSQTDRGTAEFGNAVRALTDGKGVVAVYDGVGRSTFDASLASVAVRGTLALFGAASRPVPPVDPQRLNTAGSVYLTRPLRTHFNRDYAEFAWRAGECSERSPTGRSP